MLIISKPPEIDDDTEAGMKKKETELDFNELDVDLLRFSGLDSSDLDKKNALDRNDLNAELLDFYSENELDRQNASLLSNELDNPILPNYSANRAQGLLYYFNEDQSRVTLYRATTHQATMTFSTDINTTYTLNQGGQALIQNINKGGDNIVTVIQK
jgi:hypothetical protein